MESYRKIIKLVNKMGDDRESNKKIISKSGIETYALDITIILKKSNNIKKVLEFINVCYELNITRWNIEMTSFLAELYDKLLSEFGKVKIIDKEIINKLYKFINYEYLFEVDFLALDKINNLITDEKTKEYATKSFNNLKKKKYLYNMIFLADELDNKEDNEFKEYIIEIFGDVNYNDEKGSLLHYSIDTISQNDERFFSICSKLLEIGVNPNLVDEVNYTFLYRYLKASNINRETFFELLKISIECGFSEHDSIFLDVFIKNIHHYNSYKLIVDNGCQITDSFNFKEVDGWCCEDAKKISISAHFRLMLSNIKVIFNKYSFEENFDKKLFYIEEELFAIFEEMLEMDDSWYDIQSLIVGNILKNKESEIVLNKMISANEVIDAIYEIYKNKLNEKKRETQVKILEYTSNQVGGHNGKL